MKNDKAFVRSVVQHPRNSTTEDALRVLQLVRSRFAESNNLVIVDQYSRIFESDDYVKQRILVWVSQTLS